MAEGLVTQGAATLRVLLKEKIIQRAAQKVGVSVRLEPRAPLSGAACSDPRFRDCHTHSSKI